MTLLKDKVAIITGGTAGIGRAIAFEFAKAGAHIAVVGTNTERGQAVVNEIISQYGVKAHFYKTNVASFSDVENCLKDIANDFPVIDILVNNAGITKDGLMMKMSEENWDIVIDTNLKSVFNFCKLLARQFLKARQGKIINVTSVIGLTGNAGQGNYAASKAGMVGLTKSLALEFASRNIQVNCIAPGFIETSMTDGLSDEIKKNLLEQIPMGRMGKTEEIASAALFLASDMSNYITAQVLVVDGGMVR
ncbi:MAG: 3-oxoacyl-[acyl-carrier-protein] reductase [Parachlamydiales bacterium]|nr:3-oxoacyl-[acyl-carrier-protein] reductase [Parachlamydiales bacterium]